MNTSSKIKPWTDWSYEDSKFSIDETKIPWPLYRDWTQEAATLHRTIVKAKKDIIAEEKSIDLLGRREEKDKSEFI